MKPWECQTTCTTRTDCCYSHRKLFRTRLPVDDVGNFFVPGGWQGRGGGIRIRQSKHMHLLKIFSSRKYGSSVLRVQEMTPAKNPKQRFLRASQLAGDRGRPAGRPGDRLERKSYFVYRFLDFYSVPARGRPFYYVFLIVRFTKYCKN